MEAGRVTLSIVLATILTLSTLVSPASAQLNDDKQPSETNTKMYIFGNNDLTNCFTHFDNNDTANSAEEGYGEKTWSSANSQVEVDYTCAISEKFRENMYLNNNGTIEILLNFRVDADDQNCGQGNTKCENLNLTFMKGGVELARQEFPALSVDDVDDTVTWNIPVDRNTTVFNKSSEEPRLRVEFSYPTYNGDLPGGCAIWYCGGAFRMYYHTPDNTSAEVVFPIVNNSMAIDDDSEANTGGGGASVAGIPGFGLMAGVSALAMAAVAVSRKSEE